MGLIREPDGVDFIIAPAAYTDADRAEVTAFLHKHKTPKMNGHEGVLPEYGFLRVNQNVKERLPC